eukprot:UN32551
MTSITKTSYTITQDKNLLFDGQNVENLMQMLDYATSNDLDVGHLIDLDSFARYYMVQELAKDVDGYVDSNYFVMKNNKLYHGPAWDFHMGYGFSCNDIWFTNYKTGEVNLDYKGWHVEDLRDRILLGD